MRDRLTAFIESAVLVRWKIVRLLPAVGLTALVSSFFLNVALGLLPIVFMIAMSVMLGRIPAALHDGAASAGWDGVLAAFAVAACAFAVQQVIAPLQVSLAERMTRRVDGGMTRRLMSASLSLDGIGPLEDQGVLDELAEASRELQSAWGTPGSACGGLVALVARYVQLLGCVTVVGVVFSWPAAGGVAVITTVFRYGQRGGMRKYARLYRTNIAERRKSDYFRDTATGSVAAKEIRIFGLAGWLTARYRAAYLDWLMPVWAERRRIYLWPYLWFTAAGLCALVWVLGTAAAAAAESRLSVAQLALVVQATLAAVRLGDFYPEADQQTQNGMGAYDAVGKFERSLAAAGHAPRTGLARGAATGSEARGAAVPAARLRPARQIRFDGVTFAYRDDQPAVLRQFDLVIPAGRSTAIVGLNGAGKTTLVKLLARLYEPTGGRLLADGADIRTVPIETWRRELAVIFQDFNRYQMPAALNIGFGAVESSADRVQVAAAARQAGILDVLDRLPEGLATPLARQIPGGVDLSGGEWQRVALARALFALGAGASILVLDEPTASLDVRAEARFFTRFLEVTRGVTTILISHRFSSVRHADNIAVIEDGQVAEHGSHGELLAFGGRYAQLFRLQAERFRGDHAAATPRAGGPR